MSAPAMMPTSSSLTPSKEAPVSKDDIAVTNSNLDRICNLTERLVEVIERETGLLRAVRSVEAKSVQQEKAVLTQAYEAESALIKALDRTELLTDPRMPELVRLSGLLADATAENEAALVSTMRLNSSFMALVARSATASATAAIPATYGAALNNRQGRARPVAVNTAY